MRPRHRHRPSTDDPTREAVIALLLLGVLMALSAVFDRSLLPGLVALSALALLAVGGLFALRLTRNRAAVAVAPGPDPGLEASAFRVIPLDEDSIDEALRRGRAPETTHLPTPSRTPTAQTTRVLTLEERLRAIDWFQFERLMEAAFRKAGYRVDRRGGAHADDGIDLVIERGGETTAVQCKHWKAWKVNPKTVRELLGAMTGGKVPHGMILTLKGYTRDARVKAQEYGITIWDETEILQHLRTVDAESDPEMIRLLDDRRKFCPRCESPMILRTSKRGPDMGSKFWGCSRYPACKHTLTEGQPFPEPED